MQNDIVERVVAAPFERVRQAVEQAIADAGMALFARIDHAAGARAADMKMPATQVLIFGNARAGTPVMLLAPLAALDLPLHLLLRAVDEAQTALAYRPVRAAFSGLAIDAALLDKLEAAQRRIAGAVQ